jgi:hypothetical protein
MFAVSLLPVPFLLETAIATVKLQQLAAGDYMLPELISGGLCGSAHG